MDIERVSVTVTFVDGEVVSFRANSVTFNEYVKYEESVVFQHTDFYNPPSEKIAHTTKTYDEGVNYTKIYYCPKDIVESIEIENESFK